jgi:hypothetical protein
MSHRPTKACPIVYRGHAIAWDEAEQAYAVAEDVASDQFERFAFVFHYSGSIDDCLETIDEVVNEYDCQLHGVKLSTPGGDCPKCVAAIEDLERERVLEVLGRPVNELTDVELATAWHAQLNGGTTEALAVCEAEITRRVRLGSWSNPEGGPYATDVEGR